MDSKRMKSLAVAAGVTAVLAMSPVVGPAVTALATDGSSTQLLETQQTYFVTYEYCGGVDADGNTGSKEVEYKANTTLKTGNKNPSVTLDGYTFEGWYTDPDYTSDTKVSVLTYTVTGNVTLYAHWVQNPTITFYNEISYDDMTGATAWLVDEAAYGKSYAKPDNPELPENADSEDYIFKGWFTDPSLDEEYEFTGWNSGFTEDTVLYAKWKKFPTVTYYLSPESKEPCYSVVVDLNASPDERRDSLKVSTIEAELSDKIPEGYSIDGFYTDPDYTERFTDFAYVDEDTTLYIKFVDEDGNQPTVTYEFVDEDGNELAANSVQDYLFNYADEQEAPDGYRIVGYFVGGISIPDIADYEITGDTTITVKCAETDPEPPAVETYEVIFDDCLASTENQVITVNEGDTIDPADVNTPVCEGWNFLGWFTDTALTQEFDFTSPITDNMTVYAKWEKVTTSGNDDGTTEDPADVTKPGDQSAADTVTDKADAEEETLPKTGDASVLVSGVAALGTVLAGAGVVTRRRR